MIGGTVVNTVELKDKIRIDVVDDKTKDKCSVYCELTPAARCIERNHTIWWQGEYILWTHEKRELLRDFKLKKIGYSFQTPEDKTNEKNNEEKVLRGSSSV